MILFREDWNKYPSAIIDTSTKNTSYLKLAALYREMGVSNNSFMLALINPALQGIDPHAVDIDDIETQGMIAIESKVNPWYFFREVSRVPGRGTPVPSPLLANRGNIALYWLFFNHITTILIQIRQTGKSVSVDSLYVYLLNIYCVYTSIAMLTKDDALRSFNLDRLKGIQLELPPYLNQKRIGDISNTEMMTIRALNNEFRALVPNKSPKMALNIGRGITVPIMGFDEAAFTANIEISMPAALAAGTAVRDMAKKNGDPFGTLITTTAGKKDDRDGRFIHNMVVNSAVWAEPFFDCENLEELEEVIRKNSPKKALRVNCTFNHRQLGYSDAWLKAAIEAVEAGDDSEEDIGRDFFNEWSSGSITSPLSKELTAMIRASEKEPLFTEISHPYGYIVRWYVPEDSIPRVMSSKKTILALDTSDAAGGDDIGLVLRDVESGAVLANSNINETNLITFSEWIVQLLVKYPNITLIVERRSTGSTILDYILLMLVARDINPFKRIYNKVVQDHEEDRARFDSVGKGNFVNMNDLIVKHKKAFGFATSAVGATSRTDLYSSTLLASSKFTGAQVYDTTLINQILGLVVKNGRVDHQDGEHDDLCFIGTTLVRTITGNRQIKDLKVGDLVLTRQGYKPIVKLFCSKKKVITKYGITGTLNHPFITPNGEIEFQDLKLETKVYKWNERLSIIEEKTIIDILNQKGDNIETTIIDMISGMNLLSHYIGKSMKIIVEQYLQVITFIIKMVTFPIMPLRISNVSAAEITVKNIQYLKKNVKDDTSWEKKKIILVHGVKKIQNLVKNMLPRMVKNLKDYLTGGKKIQNLQNKFIQKLLKRASKQEERIELVYNIMVEDCHEYFVNDILVHNCIAWLLSYWLISKGKMLDFYGIDSRTILVSNPIKNKLMATENSYDSREQRHIKEQIDLLVDQIKAEKDIFITQKLESKLKALYSQYEVTDGTIVSVDDLIRELREFKRTSRVSMTSNYNMQSGYNQGGYRSRY